MLPTSVCSTPAFSHVSQLDRHLSNYSNTPEEDDETMSTHGHQAAVVHRLDCEPNAEDPTSAEELLRRLRLDKEQEVRHRHTQLQGHSFSVYQPHAGAYGGPTPFHSQVDGSWLHPSSASCSGYHNSLPSCLSHKDYSNCSEESFLSCSKFLSLPSGQSSVMSSLEQPLSLHSIPPSSDLCHHTLSPYLCSPQGAACCAQCPPDQFTRGPTVNKPHWPQYHPGPRTPYPGDFRLPGPPYTHIGHNVRVKEKSPPFSGSLSLEQRRVFVTYEADSDKHVNEVINFVALLRHNGFDTHIDIFEQQFRSISKIDFMERYLSEKEYLIIIIISPKYYNTVTAPPIGLENDERTFNTVYIHKQLQNEFIQNGSKNFRFIPILFPGAKRCHVPTWLQNTNIYSWPRDRDDILRRLMRVEKYNPPPIGELPTIVSIPI